jgi:6-pyruvoyltetrahydropterin/6-carboxytetrahydropterin synthase
LYEVTIRNRFAAAHSLVDYQGPCSRVHGHTWYVEVSVCGSELNQLGMLIDFHELKRLLNNIIEQLDHQNLNFLEPFVNGKGANPTAENLAKYIFDGLKHDLTALNDQLKVGYVRVWESPDASAVYREVGSL